jgi:hypothetical protein
LNYDNATYPFRRIGIRTGKKKEELAGEADQTLDDVVEARRVGEDPGTGFSVLEVTFPYRNHRSIYVRNNRDQIYKIVDDDGLGLSELEVQ